MTSKKIKSYYHHVNKIPENRLFEGLVGFGLFPEKIPNFLSSEKFLGYISQNHIKNNKIHIIKEEPSDYIRYNNMRNTSTFRPLSIPAPFAYANLCYCIKSNWGKIKKHFKKNTKHNLYKISRIHIRNLKNEKSLFKMSYNNFEVDGTPTTDIVINKKYKVSADVSKCYPTMYSHSIPWALVGKEQAKKNRDDKEWFNQLDFHTRNTKYGETNGLLIGPHAYNILSEIILTTVDKKLTDLGFEYIRNIDDYTCYTKSHEKSTEFLLSLSKELAKYELTLNHKKSKIEKLPLESENSWVNDLRRYTFHEVYYVEKTEGKNKIKVESINTKEVKLFLDFAVRLMSKNKGNASILSYAIKTISSKNLGYNAKKFFIKRIHYFILLYPYLCPILETHVFGAHDIKEQDIKPLAIDLYKNGISTNNYEACSYSIYWSLKYNFQFDNGYEKPSEQNNHKYPFSYYFKEDALNSRDCIFMLIAFLYDKKHKIPTRPSYKKEYKKKAQELKEIEFKRYWLFVYEVLPESLLSSPYKEMKKSNISFVKKKFNNPT